MHRGRLVAPDATRLTLPSCPQGPVVPRPSIFPGTVGIVVFLIYTLPPPVERRVQRMVPLFNRIGRRPILLYVRAGEHRFRWSRRITLQDRDA